VVTKNEFILYEFKYTISVQNNFYMYAIVLLNNIVCALLQNKKDHRDFLAEINTLVR